LINIAEKEGNKSFKIRLTAVCLKMAVAEMTQSI
jgi:hypothetical protein